MGRMIAALLFILVVAFAALAAALPFVKNAALRDEIAVTRELVAQRERLQAAGSGTPGPDGRDALLKGDSSGILAADLQRRMAELAKQNGMSLRSMQVLPPKRDGDLTAISLEVSLRGEITGLQTLLYTVETGAPVLFVEALSVKSATTPEATARSVGLDVTLKVRGYGAAKETN